MTLAVASIVFAALFLGILLLLHFLKPELDPSWRMISEYEIGRFGWLMRLAFFCWGASVLTLLITLWPSLQPAGGTISRWWFALITLALFGAGIFKTDPITQHTPHPVNTIHTICGAIVILTFPIAATLAVVNLQHAPAWDAARGPLVFGTGLTWIGMVAYFASIIISGMVHPEILKTPDGNGGPLVYQGWPNRFLVVTYITWLILLAATLLRI